MMYLHFVALLIGVFFISSCATIFNSRTTPIHITVSEPSNILINHDTIATMQTSVVYRAERKEPNVELQVSSESKTKDFHLKRQMSVLMWSNLIGPFGILGVLTDGFTHRGYTHPQRIYIDYDNSSYTYRRYDSEEDARKNIIKLTPFKIICIVNPSAEIAYERIVSHKLSAQFKAGYLLSRSIDEIHTKITPNRKGYLLSVEPKFYFREKAPYGMYLSMEGSYLKSNYSMVEWFDIPHPESVEDDDTYYENETYSDSIGVHKRNSAINLKLGYVYTYKRFILDAYVGLGAFHKHVWHTDRLHPEHTLTSPQHPNIWYLSQVEQRQWTIGIPMNFSIGYRF